MSDNLLRIGTSAILASTALLSTTSNNIANLNTPGYSRQRTEFESNMLGSDCLPSPSSSAAEKNRSKALENRVSCCCFIRFACKGDLFFLVNQLDHE